MSISTKMNRDMAFISPIARIGRGCAPVLATSGMDQTDCARVEYRDRCDERVDAHQVLLW